MVFNVCHNAFSLFLFFSRYQNSEEVKEKRGEDCRKKSQIFSTKKKRKQERKEESLM